MDKFKRFTLLLLFIIASAGLLIGFWGVVFDFIILPIAVLAWEFWRILVSVDQSTYWLILILTCSFAFVRLFLFSKGKTDKLAYRESARPAPRVEYWAALVSEAGRGANERDYLRSNLLNLTMAAINVLQRSDRTAAEERMETRMSALPAEARQFLSPSAGDNGKFSLHRPAAISRGLTGRFRSGAKSNGHPTHPEVEAVLNWLEHELEIHDER